MYNSPCVLVLLVHRAYNIKPGIYQKYWFPPSLPSKKKNHLKINDTSVIHWYIYKKYHIPVNCFICAIIHKFTRVDNCASINLGYSAITLFIFIDIWFISKVCTQSCRFYLVCWMNHHIVVHVLQMNIALSSQITDYSWCLCEH